MKSPNRPFEKWPWWTWVVGFVLCIPLIGCAGTGGIDIDPVFVEARIEHNQRRLDLLAEELETRGQPSTAADVRRISEVLGAIGVVVQSGEGGDSAADSILESIDLGRRILEEVLLAFVDDPGRQERIRNISFGVQLLLEEVAFWVRQAPPAPDVDPPESPG